MSAMVNLEIPWINVMSKMDLVTGNTDDPAGGRNGIRTRRNIARLVSRCTGLLRFHELRFFLPPCYPSFISAHRPCGTHHPLSHMRRVASPLFSIRIFTLASLIPAYVYRYLDPDPLLLATPRGRGDELNSASAQFHALNQAIVQLVSLVASFKNAYHRVVGSWSRLPASILHPITFVIQNACLYADRHRLIAFSICHALKTVQHRVLIGFMKKQAARQIVTRIEGACRRSASVI